LGYFCYPNPKPGYQCQLTTCQSICPSWMMQCGVAACSSSATTCSAHITQMVLDVGLAVVQTATMVATFGTAGAGASQALSAQSRAAFKQAAKATINGFKKRVAEKGVKDATREAIKKSMKKYAADHLEGTLTEAHAVNQAALATNAIVAQIEGSDEQDMEQFDFTAWDPTGVASAVSTSLDKDSSDIETAAAWTLAVGTFDPTGWITAAAAFMKGTCDTRTTRSSPPPPPPPPPPLPPLPPPPPLISSTGPCKTYGKCACSSNYDASCTFYSGSKYKDNEECTVNFSSAVLTSWGFSIPTFSLLFSPAFSTENAYDKVTVNGVQYSGSMGPNGVVASSMTWSSDGSVVGDGWKICQT